MNRANVFLEAYKISGNVSRAARAAGISRDMHHRRMRKDPAYAEAFAAAYSEAEQLKIDEAVRRAKEQEDDIHFAEDELYRRAIYGYPEPVVFQGQFTYPPLLDKDGQPLRDSEKRALFSKEPLTVTKFVSADLQFYLKAAKPEKYRERHQHEVSGKVDLKFAGSMAELLATFREMTAQEPEEDS